MWHVYKYLLLRFVFHQFDHPSHVPCRISAANAGIEHPAICLLLVIGVQRTTWHCACSDGSSVATTSQRSHCISDRWRPSFQETPPIQHDILARDAKRNRDSIQPNLQQGLYRINLISGPLFMIAALQHLSFQTSLLFLFLQLNFHFLVEYFSPVHFLKPAIHYCEDVEFH